MKLIWAYNLFRSWDNTRLDSACKAFMFVNGENVPLTQPHQAKVIVSKHMPVQQIYTFVPPKSTKHLSDLGISNADTDS